MRKMSQSYRKRCKEVDNQLEFYAMMRSGQHAIINWLFSQIRSPIYFRNDILCHKGEKARFDRGVWKKAKSNPPVSKFPWYAYNAEDISILNFEKIYKEYSDMLCKVPPKRKIRVLIIRDPFNMFASRYRFFKRINTIRRESGKRPIEEKHKTNKNSNISWYEIDAFNRWKEYAKEALGDTDYLGDNKVVINYNHWFKHKHYRSKVSEGLGFNFSDSRLNFVPSNGYGSSFDLQDMNGNAQDMKVLDRWMRIPDSGRFKRRFDDPELINLSYRLWPDLTNRVLKGKDILSTKNKRRVNHYEK